MAVRSKGALDVFVAAHLNHLLIRDLNRSAATLAVGSRRVPPISDAPHKSQVDHDWQLVIGSRVIATGDN